MYSRNFITIYLYTLKFFFIQEAKGLKDLPTLLGRVGEANYLRSRGLLNYRPGFDYPENNKLGIIMGAPGLLGPIPDRTALSLSSYQNNGIEVFSRPLQPSLNTNNYNSLLLLLFPSHFGTIFLSASSFPSFSG